MDWSFIFFYHYSLFDSDTPYTNNLSISNLNHQNKKIVFCDCLYPCGLTRPKDTHRNPMDHPCRALLRTTIFFPLLEDHLGRNFWPSLSSVFFLLFLIALCPYIFLNDWFILLSFLLKRQERRKKGKKIRASKNSHPKNFFPILHNFRSMQDSNALSCFRK